MTINQPFTVNKTSIGLRVTLNCPYTMNKTSIGLCMTLNRPYTVNKTSTYGIKLAQYTCMRNKIVVSTDRLTDLAMQKESSIKAALFSTGITWQRKQARIQDFLKGGGWRPGGPLRGGGDRPCRRKITIWTQKYFSYNGGGITPVTPPPPWIRQWKGTLACSELFRKYSSVSY